MNEDEALQIFSDSGAWIRNGHFVYRSGNHGGDYVNKDVIFQHPEKTAALSMGIATYFKDYEIDIVNGPVVGGAIIAQWVAYHLSNITGQKVLSVYTDKKNEGGFEIRRGYENIIPGKRMLIVEDVINAGGTIGQVVKISESYGAEVAGGACWWNRGNPTKKDLGFSGKVYSIINKSLPEFTEKNCDLCMKGIPINTKIGKGAQFLARKSGGM